MITPRFNLTQTEKTVSIHVRAPYCSLKELEISVEDNMFMFICRPYYLRLNLPGKITENEGTMNADTGEFTFKCDKMNPGEHFPNLDFITTLLCPKVEVQEGERKIEVVSSGECSGDGELEENQVLYGFAMRGGYNFNIVSSEFQDVFKINPHEIELEQRKCVRLNDEKNDFNLDHYMADLIESDEIQEMLSIKTPWNELDAIQFTAEEFDFLKDLVNIEYGLSPKQINYCFNGLIEILYAFCYDGRTTFYDSTCESGWTLSTLCASFSYFDGFETPKEALICAFRRSLIYPLYRSFELSQQVLLDLQKILALGENYIVKCLIQIYNLLMKGDRYILNNLFIKDYIVYVMKWDADLWKKVVEEIIGVSVDKKDLGLGLLEIEACLEDTDGLNEQLSGLNLNQLDSDDSESSSSDESDTTSSDTSSDDDQIKEV